jgi:hypothetical protein
MIFKKANGDEHKFCTALMEKTVDGIGILNSDLFSDQYFLQCGHPTLPPLPLKGPSHEIDFKNFDENSKNLA